MSNNFPKTLVFIGGPGSGKDTQIELLSSQFDFSVLSTGEIAREKEKVDEKVKQILESGELISDRKISEWLLEALTKVSKEKALILNGYPRDLSQAKELESLLEKVGRRLDRVIYLKVSETELEKRLSERKVCSICGKDVSKELEKCPACEGAVVRREDDNKEAIVERIKIFEDNFKDILDFYRSNNLLLEIDGERAAELIAEDIRSNLNDNN